MPNSDKKLAEVTSATEESGLRNKGATNFALATQPSSLESPSINLKVPLNGSSHISLRQTNHRFGERSRLLISNLRKSRQTMSLTNH